MRKYMNYRAFFTPRRGILTLAVVLVALTVSACSGDEVEIGPQGPIGVQGKSGDTGSPGSTGLRGFPGPAGPVGLLVTVRLPK